MNRLRWASARLGRRQAPPLRIMAAEMLKHPLRQVALGGVWVLWLHTLLINNGHDTDKFLWYHQ